MQSATSVFPDVLPRPAMPQTLAPAFAASLAVHAVMLLALVSWVAVGDRVQLPGRDALAVLLVGAPAPVPPEAPPGDHAIAVPAQEAPLLPGPSVPADARSAEPAPPANEVPAAAAPAPATPASTRVVSLGTVDVQLLADYPVTSLHPVHEARAASEFPVEVPRGVRLSAKPDIKYPEDALAAGRRGSVLAFVIVDASGGVEEVSIVEGAPEFAQTVQDALLATRFLPASDGDRPIRFYTMLRFDFLPNSPGADPAADARGKPGAE